jgi:amino acid transporter
MSSQTVPQVQLRTAMGLRDVVLLFVTAGTNLQWVATAAAAGPSSITAWILTGLAMFLPLAYCVVDMSSRYPQEGGIYVWTKRAFGDFAGFITGWTYWTSNLPYFPGLLYFAASNALFIGPARWRALSDSPTYFILAALLGLALGTVVNVIGLDVGKWLTNVGALCRWLATLALIGIGIAAWLQLGSATEWSLRSLKPSLGLRDVIFWSTLAFAWTGFEAASFMGDEIADARRTIPRAIFASAPLIALIYIAGTVSVLVALPVGEVSALQGIMQAIERAAQRSGLPILTPLVAGFIVVTALGSVGAWLAAVARIPFVAGVDRYLPGQFARIHPRWGSPYVALLTQSLITVVFVFLGQAGTSVRGAYNALVSLTVIVTLLPFLLIFASAIKLQGEPKPAGAARLPGGRSAVVTLAIVGLLTTVSSIILSAFPAQDEANKPLAVAKVIGLTGVTVGAGVLVYVLGRKRARGPQPS